MEAQNLLKNQWNRLNANYGASENVVNEIYDLIIEAYSSTNRHYHNLDHIAALFKSAEEYKNKIADYDSLLFAVWFHDIVYKATASDNEAQSAELAKVFLTKLNVPQEKILKVNHMILATKNHMDLPDDVEEDTKKFLDFDLQILGAERANYIEYMKQIREEYRLVPDFLYNSRRKKILKKFLEAPHLYKTAGFRKLYEEQAKENIKFEIEQL